MTQRTDQARTTHYLVCGHSTHQRDIKNNQWNERFTLLLAESTGALKEEVSDIRVIPETRDRCFMGGMKSSSASWGGIEVLAARFLLFQTGAY
jgi:hypothetical protein